MTRPFSHIAASGCITPAGDARQTYDMLLSGQRSLRMQPVFGSHGDKVPLSTFESIESTLPPKWLTRLETLVVHIPPRPWGAPGYPVVITSSNFGIGHILAYHDSNVDEHLQYAQAHTSVEKICGHFGWQHSASILSHACVSADVGMLHASRLLHKGAAHEVLVFSFDFLSPFVTGGFNSLKILNGSYPAPYANQENGSIGLGDGAAFVVLSREPARFRISHQNLANEMFHMTANQPDGAGFRNALSRIAAEIGATKVWVKGHGTGTLEAGKLEAQAVANVFPGAPLVSWKGGIGHTLGSCGLVEINLAIEAMRHGQVPGTVGTTGPTWEANVKTGPFSCADFQGAVLSSNAFGGAHASSLLTDTHRTD